MLSRVGHSLAGGGLSPVLYLLFSMLMPVSAGRRAFSQSATRQSYENTIKNLLVHKDTKVICQGFTGKTVREPFFETRVSSHMYDEYRELSM